MRKFLYIFLALLITVPVFGAQIVKAPLTSNLTDSKGNLTAGALSRVTAATYVDYSTGLLTTAWGDRDQLIPTVSQDDISHANWTRANVEAYDSGKDITVGGIAFQELEEPTDTNQQHRIYDASLGSAGTYVLSAYFKANERIKAQLWLYNGTDGTVARSIFNISDGSIVDTFGGISGVETIDASNGIYRCYVVGTQTVASVAYIQIIDDGNNAAYNGVQGKGIYVAQIMLEELPSGNVIGSDLFDQEALGSEEYDWSNNAASDGGTEADATTGWSAHGGATLSSESDNVDTGTYALKCINNWCAEQFSGMTLGKRYRLDFAARHIGSGGDWEIGTDSGNVGPDGQFFTLTSSDTSYQDYTIYFIYSDSESYMLTDDKGSGDGGVYIDNIRIKEVTTPAKGEFTHPAILGDEITVNNPGFETAGGGGADVWANWTENALGSDIIANETTNVNSGSDAAKITNVDNGGSYAYNAVTVSASTLYNVKFYTRGDGSVGGRYRFYDQSNTTWLTGVLTTGVTGTSYEQFSAYVYAPAGCTVLRVYFYAPNSAGDAYYDDISIRPVQISWAPYGTNTIEIDESENALKISYVDNDAGASLILKNVTDLSADLVVGQEYLITFDYWVTTGDSFKMEIWGGGSEQVGITLNQDSSTSVEVVHTAQSTTSDFIRFDDMAATEAVWIDNLTIKAIPPLDLLEPSTYVNSATITADPRFESAGLLLEGEATNLLEYSEDFSQWTMNNTKSTAFGSTTDPKGETNTASGMIADAAADEPRSFRYTFPEFQLTDNTIHTFSAFVKAGVVDWVLLQAERKDDTATSVYFDLTNVAIGATPLNAEDEGIEAIGGGWYRVWIAFDSTSGSTVPYVRVYAAEGDGDVAFSANEDDEVIYVFGAQLEATPYPTSYIPTDGTQVTRTTEAGANGATGLSWTMGQAVQNIVSDATIAGTLILTYKFGWTPADITTAPFGGGNVGVVSFRSASSTSILYIEDGVHDFKSADDTAAEDADNTAADPVSGDEVTVVVRWVASGDWKISDNGSGSWVHSSDASDLDADGFVNNDVVWLHYGNEYPAHIKNLYMYDTYLTDEQVEGEIWAGRKYWPFGLDMRLIH